jgi:hypothetical protein
MYKKAPYQLPYCLYCYAALERKGNWASQHCERCSRVTLHQDVRIYWTQHRNMVQYEWAAKIFTFGLAAAVYMWLFTSHTGGGTGQGWAIGFPFTIIVLGCETAGKLTKYKPYFRAELAWKFLFLAPTILFLPLMLIFNVVPNEGQVLAILTAFGALGALCVHLFVRSFCRFRKRVILHGQQ